MVRRGGGGGGTSLAATFLGTPQVRVERIVEEGRPRHDVRIVAPHVGEPLADRPEAGGFPLGAGLLGEVGAMHDAREPHEGTVMREALGDDLLERAAAVSIPVEMLRAGGVEADRVFASLDFHDLIRLHEEDLGLGIQEAPDEPRGRGSVDVDALPGHPFHQCPSTVRSSNSMTESAFVHRPTRPASLHVSFLASRTLLPSCQTTKWRHVASSLSVSQVFLVTFTLWLRKARRLPFTVW